MIIKNDWFTESRWQKNILWPKGEKLTLGTGSTGAEKNKNNKSIFECLLKSAFLNECHQTASTNIAILHTGWVT